MKTLIDVFLPIRAIEQLYAAAGIDYEGSILITLLFLIPAVIYMIPLRNWLFGQEYLIDKAIRKWRAGDYEKRREREVIVRLLVIGVFSYILFAFIVLTFLE